MTETLARPARPDPRRPEAVAGAPVPAVVSGALAAASAAAIGLLLVVVPVLAVWAAEDRSRSGAAEAMRLAGQLWLLAHGGELDLPDGRFGLTPLGLSLVPLWLCWRAGRHVARLARTTTARAVVVATASVALPYAAVTGAVAAAAQSTAVRPSPPVALVTGLLVAVLGASAGAVRAVGAGPALWARLPRRAVAPLRGGAAAAVLLLGAGALVVLLGLVTSFGAAAELARASAPGAVGGAGLLLLGVALAPNAVVAGASWLAGPGFAVGTGTGVGPFGVELGAVPGLPLLAALPSGVPPWPLAVLALAVPVLAGAAAGALVHRSVLLDPPRGAPTGRGLLAAAGTGPVAGAVLGLLAVAAGGPVGGERLAAVGPSAWQVAAAVSLEVGAGAVVAVVLLRARSVRRSD